MSDERGHRGHASRGGIGRWAMIAGWVIAAALAGHLVLGMLRGRSDPAGGSGALLPDRVYFAVAFWAPAAVLVLASAAGIFWTAKVYARREKSSVLWMRHAFTFGVLSAILLAVVTFQDPKRFRREWLVAAVAAIAAAQMAFFANAAFRDYRRSAGHRSSRRDDDDEDGDPE